MSDATFWSRLQLHVGNLIRLKIDYAGPHLVRRGSHPDPARFNGKLSLLLDALPTDFGTGAWIVLLVDGGSQSLHVRDGEVEFIGGDGD